MCTVGAATGQSSKQAIRMRGPCGGRRRRLTNRSLVIGRSAARSLPARTGSHLSCPTLRLTRRDAVHLAESVHPPRLAPDGSSADSPRTATRPRSASRPQRRAVQPQADHPQTAPFLGSEPTYEPDVRRPSAYESRSGLPTTPASNPADTAPPARQPAPP